MMPLPQTIMVFDDDPETVVSFAVATVLSTLFGIETLVLKANWAVAPSEFPQKSVLIISGISQERQIGRLAGLRLHGFIGGALIISQSSFESLRARHRILRWGHGSHDVCHFPCSLVDLLIKVAEITPLEPENLHLLQNEIKAPDRLIDRRVIPCLKRLGKRNRDLDREINDIITIIGNLRACTPVACHAVVKIGGRKAQIQKHFKMLVEELRKLQDFDNRPVVLLRELFERWRSVLIDVGEGVGLSS